MCINLYTSRGGKCKYVTLGLQADLLTDITWKAKRTICLAGQGCHTVRNDFGSRNGSFTVD